MLNTLADFCVLWAPEISGDVQVVKARRWSHFTYLYECKKEVDEIRLVVMYVVWSLHS